MKLKSGFNFKFISTFNGSNNQICRRKTTVKIQCSIKAKSA